jgi:hypothetical protein
MERVPRVAPVSGRVSYAEAVPTSGTASGNRDGIRARLAIPAPVVPIEARTIGGCPASPSHTGLSAVRGQARPPWSPLQILSPVSHLTAWAEADGRMPSGGKAGVRGIRAKGAPCLTCICGANTSWGALGAGAGPRLRRAGEGRAEGRASGARPVQGQGLCGGEACAGARPVRGEACAGAMPVRGKAGSRRGP